MKIEKPIIFSSERDLPSGVQKIDTTESAKKELYFVENPHTPKTELAGEVTMNTVWIYFPWLNRAVLSPDKDTYFKLRTARNRNLITEAEQKMYRKATIGIAGLSVGSTALASIVGTGGPERIKLADPDILEITNLNRIKATLPDVGMNKTEIAAKNAWEVDPFLEIELWKEGVRKNDLEKFISEPKLDVFIDEMDNIAMKFAVRNACREMRIPVIMATDNGDGAILDVERFDDEPASPIFHGRVKIEEEEMKDLSREAFVKMANEIIDPKMFTERQWTSIQTIGNEISGIPQIHTAASIAGAAVAYAVRQILTKKPMPSGRYILSPEKIIC